MRVLVEIGHPDADISPHAERVSDAIRAAGFTVVEDFNPRTGHATITPTGAEVDDIPQMIVDSLAEQLPAFVEMNPFYVHVIGTN